MTAPQTDQRQPIAIAPGEVDRIIRLPEVMRITSLSRSSIYRKLAEPRSPLPFPPGYDGPLPFPLAIDIGENAVGWWLSEVMAYARSLPRRRVAPIADAAE